VAQCRSFPSGLIKTYALCHKVMFVTTQATVQGGARFGLRLAWADNAGISGAKAKIQVPGRRRAGSARQHGGLVLPAFAGFHPGPTDCVADIRPLIRTIRQSPAAHVSAAVLQARRAGPRLHRGPARPLYNADLAVPDCEPAVLHRTAIE
jgi:hypothetical protein